MTLSASSPEPRRGRRSSSKTSEVSYILATGDHLGDSFSGWPTSATVSDGIVCGRPTPELLTSVRDGSVLLATPTANEHTGPGHAAQGGKNLRAQVSLLPTPTASQPGGTAEQHLARKAKMSDGANRQSVTDLRMALQLLPTPTATRGRNETSGRSNPDSTHHAGTTLEDVAWKLSGKASTAPPSSGGSPSPGQPQLPLTTETGLPFPL